MSAPLQGSPAPGNHHSGAGYDRSTGQQEDRTLAEQPSSAHHDHSPHSLGSPQYLSADPRTETPSTRPSTTDGNSSDLEDLEKGLPVHGTTSHQPQQQQHHHPHHQQQQQQQQQQQDQHQHHRHGDEDKRCDTRCAEVRTPSDDGKDQQPRPRLGMLQRLEHFTWAWYTLTMSTGGLSLLIHAQPYQFPGLRQIGTAVYVINIVFFALITSAMLARFALFRGTLTRSVTHPREGFFAPTFFLSIATIITSTQRYCVPEDPALARETAGGLLLAIRAAFWAYVVVTTSVAVGQYSYVFSAHSFGLQTMMPTWILPIFPIMLSGTIASVIAASQPPNLGVPIVVAGLTCQGLGIAVAFMMYAHMIGRLMQSGLPNREHRTGLFMCVGPPAFTALAFIGLARGLPDDFDHNLDGIVEAHIVETMGVVGAGFLWALSCWWFAIAVLAVVRSPPRYFHLSWWAAVFPNTGFTLATISLGTCFHSDTVLWFATAMSILVVLTYLFVLFNHVRAVIVQDIMYPGRDEDVEDH